MEKDEVGTRTERWARLRFAIVGRLLAAPPTQGQLRVELKELSERTWEHPTGGRPVRFGLSTIERWYYQAKNALRDPMKALRRRSRRDAGTRPSLSEPLRRVLRVQYQDHPRWSYRLHHDNLVARAREEPKLSPVASYATVRRYMQATGLRKLPRQGPPSTPGGERAARRLEAFEVRSYEATHVHGLWHLDFHQGSRPVLTPQGTWMKPHLSGMLDDRSRYCCHLQWYLQETAETLVHGLSQAFQKRALPRSVLMDHGAAMIAAETVRGLEELGVRQELTLAHSPYQNGKQESFWSQVEGRLLAMLENVEPLTLELLNEATQAWSELEYNRKVHEELGTTPLHRYLEGPDLGRPSPDSETLRLAFRLDQWRTQRKSDGTVRIEGARYEVPSCFRHLSRLRVRYARWDRSRVDLVDPRTGAVMSPLYPLDKQRNADGRRRRLHPEPAPVPTPKGPGEIAPLLRGLMREYAATGLPPAYLPKHDEVIHQDNPEDHQTEESR